MLTLAALLSSRTYLMPSPSQVFLYGFEGPCICTAMFLVDVDLYSYAPSGRGFVQLCSWWTWICTAMFWWMWICTAMLLVDVDLYSYAPGGHECVQLCSWWMWICTAMLLVGADLYSYAPGGRRFVQLCSWWVKCKQLCWRTGNKAIPVH